MLGPLRHLFGKVSGEADRAAVADWARRRGHTFRPARGNAGFVIEGLLEQRPWRLEWGPSQRAYITGRELRFRMELDLPQDQQMLLLSRPLMESLERQTYEQFTDAVQTEIGGSTPEEMRWLVMHPKVDLGSLGPFAGRFGAVASQPAVGLAWIQGPLANSLLREADAGLLRADLPVMLMTLRGKAYLRLAMARAEPASVSAALALFETAVAQAMAAAAGVTDTSAGWRADAASAWESMQPDESREREGGRPPRRR